MDEELRALGRAAEDGDEDARSRGLRARLRAGAGLPEPILVGLERGVWTTLFEVRLPLGSSVGGTFHWTVSVSGRTHVTAEGREAQVATGVASFCAQRPSLHRRRHPPRVLTEFSMDAYETGMLGVEFGARVPEHQLSSGMWDVFAVQVQVTTSLIASEIEFDWTPVGGRWPSFLA